MKLKNKLGILILCGALISGNVSVYSDVTSNTVSNWAKAEVEEAITVGFVPNDLQNNYTQPITREEFCTLVISMLNKVDGNITKVEKGGVNYIDTSNESVISASALGIVAGVGGGRFNPEGNITRQEASRMLYMSTTLEKRFTELRPSFSEKVIEMNAAPIIPHIFRDGYKIQSWAQESINYCFMYGIMQGTDNNLFDVNGTYSREQAIVTIMRLYELYSEGKSSIPKRDYLYAKKTVNGDNTSWCYINEKGVQTIDLNLDYIIYNAGSFENGYAIVDLGFASGNRVINSRGDVVASSFTNGNIFGCLAAFENSEGIVDLNTGEIIGDYIISSNTFESGVGETLVAVSDRESGLYGYYNSEGKLIIPKKYNDAYMFCSGRAIVKERNDYRLIDRFGTVISNFNPNLSEGEYIDDAVGDLYIVKKNAEYDGKFCSVAKAGKGIVLDANKNKIVNARLLNSGDIYAEDSNGKYSIYNSDGEVLFSNDKVDILYNDSADLYIATAYVTETSRYDRILTKQGKEIAIVDSDKYGITGNGTFCILNDNNITVYDNIGEVLSTISVESGVSELYCDNGVIFIVDSNNNFRGYTYLGQKLI